MEIGALQHRAMEIRQQFAQLEEETFGRTWTSEEIALGFVGDVGDLTKLVTAINGVRHIPEARQKLAHELADCLWSILVLARTFEIDLEQAFMSTMDELEIRIASKNLSG